MRYLATILLLCSAAFATNHYVAPTAGTFSGLGTSCPGQSAVTVATINNATINPGDSIVFCVAGFIASAGSANYIEINGSGTSGSGVSVVFDQQTISGTFSLSAGTLTCSGCTFTSAYLNVSALVVGTGGQNLGTITAINSSTSVAFSTSCTASTHITCPTSISSATLTVGANISAPYWSGAVINTLGNSYLTISGGTTVAGTSPAQAPGLIQATANGTNLANQQDGGAGILASNNGSSGNNNIQTENLTIANIYVHTCTLPISNCTDEGGQNTYGTKFLGGQNHLQGPNLIAHDMKWGITDAYQTGASNFQLFDDTVWNIDHGYVFGDANFGGVADQTTGSNTATCGGANGNMICGMNISDGANWDDYNGGGNPLNHHDGGHSWANNTSSSYFVIIQGNYIHGNWGVNAGSLIYIEANEQSIPVFNNVLEIDTNCPGAGTGMLGATTGTGTPGTGLQVYNNTLYGVGSTCTQGGIQIGLTTNGTVKNNLVDNTGAPIQILSNNSGTFTVDYNLYYNYGATNGFQCPTSGAVNTFAAYQTACGYDSHGTVSNPLVNASSTPYPYQPSTSGAAHNAGANLTSLSITALDTDVAGSSRPSSGSWTMGAQNTPSTTATSPTCAAHAYATGGPVQEACTNPNSTASNASIMCFTLDGTTPTSNSAGTACTNGIALSPVLAGGTEYIGYFSINVAGLTLNIIAGVAGETDSAVQTYTPTVATQKILASNFGFQCGPGEATNCPSEANPSPPPTTIPTWPTSTALPCFIRLHDSKTMWSVVEPASGTFVWTSFDGYMFDILNHTSCPNGGTLIVAQQFTNVPCWAAGIANNATTPGAACQGASGNNALPNYGNNTYLPPSDLGTGPQGSSPLFNTYVSDLLARCTSDASPSACPITVWMMSNEWDECVHFQGTPQQLYNMIAYPAQLIHAAIPNAIIVAPSATPAATGPSGCQSGVPDTDFATWMNLENTNGRISDWVDWHDYLTATSTTTHTPEVQWALYNAGFLSTQAGISGWVDAPWMNSETNWSASTGYACPTAQYSTADCTGQIVRQQILYDCYGLGSQSFGNMGLIWYYWNSTFVNNTGTPASYQTAYTYAQNFMTGGRCTSQPTNSSGTVWTANFTQSNGTVSQFVWTTSETAGQTYTVPASYTDYKGFDGSFSHITPGAQVGISVMPIMLEQAASTYIPTPALWID